MYLSIQRLLKGATLSLAFIFLPVSATIVEFQTTLGNFQVNLYDETTPKTVANFLNYHSTARYLNSIVHRSEENFVIQGGGYNYEGVFPPSSIETDDPIDNEPTYSNVKGTIAMAKLGGNSNSATSQWFINLANNSANLDQQNSGFAVFGQVIGDGMDVVEAIAALQTFNFSSQHGALGSLPLQNYTQEQFDADVDPSSDNLAIVTKIVVIDSAPDTANDLVKPENTSQSDSETSGGSLQFVLLLVLLLVARLRKA